MPNFRQNIIVRHTHLYIFIYLVAIATMTSQGKLIVNHGAISMFTNNTRCDDGKHNLYMDLPKDNSPYICKDPNYYKQFFKPIFDKYTNNNSNYKKLIKYLIMKYAQKYGYYNDHYDHDDYYNYDDENSGEGSGGDDNPVTENVSCLDLRETPDPLHICMSSKITYQDDPPRSGPHRPKWPTYGKYRYIPPQRWVHALEHGAVVFLYHPCSNITTRKLIENRLKNCMRKYIITPYPLKNKKFPFALLTYSCKYEFNTYNETNIVDFIKEHGKDPKKASEYSLAANGPYNFWLIERSTVVPGSDFNDSTLCPPISVTTKRPKARLPE